MNPDERTVIYNYADFVLGDCLIRLRPITRVCCALTQYDNPYWRVEDIGPRGKHFSLYNLFGWQLDDIDAFDAPHGAAWLHFLKSLEPGDTVKAPIMLITEEQVLTQGTEETLAGFLDPPPRIADHDSAEYKPDPAVWEAHRHQSYCFLGINPEIIPVSLRRASFVECKLTRFGKPYWVFTNIGRVGQEYPVHMIFSSDLDSLDAFDQHHGDLWQQFLSWLRPDDRLEIPVRLVIEPGDRRSFKHQHLAGFLDPPTPYGAPFA